MIVKGINPDLPHQVWADLGCGSGTFTMALGSILNQGKILAIDSNERSLNEIHNTKKQIVIEKYLENMNHYILPPNLDGILMANSLHYIKDKMPFLDRIANALKNAGRFIIVEYEQSDPNPWVPYPIGFHHLRTQFQTLGFENVVKLIDRPSLFHGKNMYSALVMR